jgi:hypothetical protein
MPMTPPEARELRAALSEALDPLYAARVGTIPALQGVQAAIAVLHRVDKALLNVINGGTDDQADEARHGGGDALEVCRRAAAGVPGA